MNPTDTLLRSGKHASRMTELSPPYRPGMDAAGEIDEVGEGAPWQVGDQVMAVVMPTDPQGGAYAEHIVISAQSIARIPAGTSYAEAATLPMNGLTARAALDRLALNAGDTVALTGAAGAFGGYLVQLAKADGLFVLADASAADEELVRGFGADVVVRRGDDVAKRFREAVPNGVDALADGALMGDLVLPAIRDGGKMALVREWAGQSEREITILPVQVYRYRHEQAKLDRLRQQVEDGTLTLRVARTYPAAQAVDAHRALEAGGIRGRLVLTF